MFQSRRSRSERSARTIALLFLAAGLESCSFSPLSDVTSLAPAVKGSAISDESAFAEASDEILLANILRARDGAPLNMGTLASINGALSLQGTAGLSFPFGGYLKTLEKGTTPSSAAVDTFTPSITGSTSPTYSFTPLNTEGFTLNVLQPISASYVLSRWNAAVSHELLLHLFVKEIDFPESLDKADQKSPVHYVKYVNNPDDANELAAFRNLVDKLLESDADLRSFDVMDPVGPKFDMYSPQNLSGPSASGSPSADTDKKLTNQPNQTAFGAITSNSDGQYHFGNASDAGGNLTFGQLYRVYAAQIWLCVNQEKLAQQGFPVPQAEPVSSNALRCASAARRNCGMRQVRHLFI